VSTLKDVKSDALSALSQYSSVQSDLPGISSIDDFELCRKEVQSAPRGAPAKYTLLEDGTIKQLGLNNWEILYVRYKDASGELLEVDVTEPSLEEEEDIIQGSQLDAKGKGRAP